MQWTSQQREAIEYRGENILLAAAAGSGKTAVLVQRIIELIGGGENPASDPADISELLVLTFTDAAASEMRGKIAAAVIRALDKDPENAHMLRQRLLLHSASISTIHSFCMNVIKNNIHLTKLPVNFSLASETENSVMMNEALDEVLERYYGRIDRDTAFRSLVMGYGGIKNDETLRKTVLSLLRFSKSMAYPSKWLCEAVRAYRSTAKSGVLDEKWQRQLNKLFDEGKREILGIYDLIMTTIDERLYPEHPYTAFFADEAAAVRALFEEIEGADYAKIRERLSAFSFARQKAGARGAEGELLAIQESVKKYRSMAKSSMEELLELFGCDEEEMTERICLTYPAVRTLKNLVLTVDRKYTRKKREKNLLDFSDLEHEALGLLTGDGGEPTETALALKEKYREILVDEYQDTNNIQDTIFRAVSRENKNIFMVGDIKQSIYKFRNASPALFLEKYRSYGVAEGEGHLIRLFKNFRSRGEVVSAVNYVFRRIMSREIGELDYTPEEYLIQGAEYPPAAEGAADTELHMICTDTEQTDDASVTFDKTELEACAAAKRIRELTDGSFEVFDAKRGTVRAARFSDVVILMRNTKSAAPVYERVLGEWGIPAYTDVGRSYLGSVEVETVLSYLQIIDNARQDIPLIAVMRSPMWGFSAEELAEMRISVRSGGFYDALSASAEGGNARAAEFMSVLCRFRERARVEDICSLLWSIYYDLGYYAYVGALPRGEERQANLRLLYERAAEFEHTKLKGLSGFLGFIATIVSEGDDMTPAKVFGEGENVVRIMSIHKSKGLEFPVVILADTARHFNMTDLSRSIIWHENAGLAAEYVDTDLRVRYPSLPRTLLCFLAKREMLSEEMRLLYVALTRAREKLIIPATFKGNEKSLRVRAEGSDGRVLAAYVRNSACFRDWLCAALTAHPQSARLREFLGIENRADADGADFGLSVSIYESPCDVPTADSAFEEQTVRTADSDSDGVLLEEIRERIGFEYPNKASGDVPVKLSVSEVKRIQSDEGEYVPMLESLRNTGMAELGKLSGAERGTVTHFIMQAAERIDGEDDVRALVGRLESEKIITHDMAKSVDTHAIARFFESTLGVRMQNAVRVEKEFSFYTEDTADAIYHSGVQQNILLQGTIDCFFEEEDGTVVLLDYKTDRAGNRAAAAAAAEKYRVQMKYYKKGLSEILGRDVDECYVYFLECGEAIEV